jgi:ornithine carbamoyltransferase
MTTPPRKRDFLSLYDVTPSEMEALLVRASELKRLRDTPAAPRPLEGKVLGMIFEKASTRTRVSFEVAIFEMGGHGVYLAQQGSQLSRGEPIQDTARVLGSYCHAIVIRTFGQHRAETLARWSPVPVINGLTDLYHPCQVAGDLFTVHELRGDIRRMRYAWIGDGNNMAHSWINAAGLLGLEVTLACPPGFEPDAEIVARARARIAKQGGRGKIELVTDPAVAAAGADVISTDVWASMGQEDEAEQRKRAFAGYCVDEKLVAVGSSDAIVLHCLPAHRGEEIAAGVLDGPRSAVWRQAENRLHIQKAILELFIGTSPR